MKVIFDLDYTLLDTTKFKKKLAEIFYGRNFQADYKKYFKNKGLNFSYSQYLKILKRESGVDSQMDKKLALKLKSLMNGLNDYLFPEAEKIIKYFKNAGAELILVTFGDKTWQRQKVKNLSIRKYFNRISFEPENKSLSRLLKSLKNGREEILIINDNAEEAKAMIKILGKKAKVFLLDGPYARNIKHNWPINKLGELL
ncbi:MAG: HAD family hydrolase [Patescibacteria group bacterium]|nr:HAD family hydrolase [Patescibacteria group bacterium]